MFRLRTGFRGRSVVPVVEELPAARAKEGQAEDGEGDVAGFGADLVVVL